MRKFVFILTAVFFGTVMAKAAAVEHKVNTVNFNAGNSFIFLENGVTFSVFPDGEFDFYVDNRINVGVGARVGNVGITFNSGFNYNPFVQFDDFGAVIQVENVPVFYDFYGRVNQIGGININYRNGFVHRIGGMRLFYNRGLFSHHVGFINPFNRRYVWRPFHRWFARPAVGFFNVWHTPYRRFYNPIRYTWHRPYRNNVRRAWAQRGTQYRFNRSRRANIYRNDNRVAVRDNNRGRRNTVARNGNAVASRNSGRSTNNVRRNSNAVRTANNRSTTARSNNSVARNSNTRSSANSRSTAKGRNNAVSSRSNRNATTTTQRTVQRTPRSTTVTKRQVTKSPQNRSVRKSSNTVKRSSNRSAVSNRTSNRAKSVQRAKAPQRRTVSRSASTKRSSSANSRTSRSSRRR